MTSHMTSHMIGHMTIETDSTGLEQGRTDVGLGMSGSYSEQRYS